MDQLFKENALLMNRRSFLSRSSKGIGGAALASLLGIGCGENSAAISPEDLVTGKGALGLPHLAPKAKRVIYLFQSGGPSQLELFDYKPLLQKMRGQELPESIRNGQRLTGMTSDQKSFPLVGSPYAFQRFGRNGTYLSEL